MKKLLIWILSLAMLISVMPTATFASDIKSEATEKERIIVDGVDITVDTEEEIYRAMNYISDLDINFVVFQTMYVADAADGIDHVEVYTTTRKIELPARNVNENSQIYATTSVAILDTEKTVNDTLNTNYVTATITIYWRDNFGPQNDFLGASCSLTLSKNPSTGSFPYLVDKHILLNSAALNSPSSQPFSDKINLGENGSSNVTYYIDANAMPAHYWSYSVQLCADIYSSQSDFLSNVTPARLRFRVETPLIG